MSHHQGKNAKIDENQPRNRGSENTKEDSSSETSGGLVVRIYTEDDDLQRETEAQRQSRLIFQDQMRTLQAQGSEEKN